MWCSSAQKHQFGLPFWSWFGFLLWACSWKSSQVLWGISQAKALGQMTQVERFDMEDVLEVPGIGGIGTKERLQCWGEEKKKVNSVCYCIFIYIYILKDSAVPAETTLVLSFGTPSGQQLVEKVGMLKICEGCIVLIQSWKEKVGGEVLGTETKLH